MDIKRKAFIITIRCMVSILVIGLYQAPDCLAADKVLKIRSITPLIEMSTLPEDTKAEDYFDIVGTLNLIEGNQVIIGNTTLELSGGVNTSDASLNDQVGVLLNKKGEVKAIAVVSDVPN